MVDPVKTDNPTQQPQELKFQDVFASLPDDVKNSENYKKFVDKPPTVIWDSYNEAQKAISKAREGYVKFPGQDAAEEERKAFYSQLGVPESFDKYESPDFGEGFKKDENLEKWFREKAHKNKFSNSQFKEFYNDFVELQKQQVAEHGNKTKALYGDKFEDAVKVANRAVEKLPDDLKKDIQKFVGYDPIVTQVLYAFGSKLGESQSPVSGDVGGGGGLADMEKRLKDIEASTEYKQGKNAVVKEANDLRFQIIKLKKK